MMSVPVLPNALSISDNNYLLHLFLQFNPRTVILTTEALYARDHPYYILLYFMHSSVQFSRSVVSDSLRPHESQHTSLPCPSPTPGVHSNSCPSSQRCHSAISSSVVPFSSLQPFPASGSFQMSQFFTSSSQSIGVSASASVLPMNVQN